MYRSIIGPSLAFAVATTAVGGAAVTGQRPTPAMSQASAASELERARDNELIEKLRTKVKYVFVIYQENRSFDSYFGTYPGAEGIYSHPASMTPGFTQTIVNTDGTTGSIQPFRIGPAQYAADTDDIDHSHPRIVAKMDVSGGAAKMDRFAMTEELKYSPTGNPSLLAKQYGELAMAHEDCDTVPLLWNYARRFVLFDAMFQEMTGPSTPGNLSIFSAQSGETQWALHPNLGFTGNGSSGAGVPVLNDFNPLGGSPEDPLTYGTVPINPGDVAFDQSAGVQDNLTYASLALTLDGRRAGVTTKSDAAPAQDLGDVGDDIRYLSANGGQPVPWGWFEEGYDRESTDQGPVTASGTHASYVTHHNGPQYFGYVSRNPAMRANLHGLGDFFNAVDHRALPAAGGVFYVKGGFQNVFGLKPTDPDANVQKNFLGDDDHPGYSDAQISEAMLAEAVNHIVKSPYWNQSAIVITWDDSEGDYDHVPPPIRELGPDGSIISDGPRVPLLVVSPYARTGYVSHELGDHASVVKFIDKVFGLTPLGSLPDEVRGRARGRTEFGQPDLGPHDANTPGIGALLSAFDPDRLDGRKPPLSPSYAYVPENLISTLPAASGFGCKALGIVPTDANLPNPIPSDFNPRPSTDPSP